MAACGTVAEAGSEAVDSAVRAATAAISGPWGRMTLAQRCDLLHAVAREIERRFDDFLDAEVNDTGKPRSVASHAKASHFELDQPAPVATIEDLARYDAIIVGTGTRFGRMSSQMASFLDQAGALWARGALHGKVGGAFTASATQHGGQETTLISIIGNLLHFGMLVVGLNYGFAGQMTMSEISGDAPYGATTITAGDGSRQPSDNELAAARYQGAEIARIAANLHD
jgi:NAD(P)H dehydrogenase (quinone)